MRMLTLLAVTLLTAVPAHADLLYTYEGSAFQLVSGEYTQADRVTGHLMLDGAFQPQSAVGAQFVPASAIRDYSLPRLPRLLKFGPGLGVEAALTTWLQQATARIAATILRAPREGVTILMPRVRVEVAEACSGLQTLAIVLAAASLIAAVLPARRLPWALALLVAAILLALEANALPVAGVALGLEYTAGSLLRTWKDWIQISTTTLAIIQLIALVRLQSARSWTGQWA